MHKSSVERPVTKKIFNRSGGFTIVELLITVAIVAILAAIAIPSYLGQAKRAARSEGHTDLQSLWLLEEQFFSENGRYPAPAGVTCAKDKPNNTTYIQQGGNPADADEALPGFRPSDSGNFSYCIESNIDLAGNAQTPCFRAQAFGNSNTRVDGDQFAIDCNNDRTF